MLAGRLHPHSDFNPRAEDQRPVPKLTMHLNRQLGERRTERHRAPRGGEVSTPADCTRARLGGRSAMREQPSGSITLVFTDIEGSTLAHVVTCASEVFC
jgi:hypothetical protein